MGEIASVIAHELHQPFAAIVNTSSAAQRRLMNEEADKITVLSEMLPIIAEQSARAGRVIGGIRKLFEGKQTERSVEEINSVVAEACELASNEFKAGTLNINQQFSHPSPSTIIDRVQIQQVIYNLLRNASDALQNFSTKEVFVSIETITGDMIRISVRNAGPELSEKTRSKLFEPFFTTKKNGMGMGLYTCQRIVEAHEGKIWAESCAEKETTIWFTLPIAGQESERADTVH